LEIFREKNSSQKLDDFTYVGKLCNWFQVQAGSPGRRRRRWRQPHRRPARRSSQGHRPKVGPRRRRQTRRRAWPDHGTWRDQENGETLLILPNGIDYFDVCRLWV